MGKKVTVFMIDGNEFGPRFIEIGNWVGKGVYCPRVAVANILTRSEVNNPGIYFLKSPPSSNSFSERVYIGEAENIGSRLRQHLNDPTRDFEELAFFISKDDLLTKSQVRFLESKFVKQAHEAKSAEIDNGNLPSLPTLPEADISDMEYFREQVKIILPLMGFRFLIPTAVSNAATSPASDTKAERIIFRIKSSALSATMYVSDEGYVVEAGSLANKDLTPSLSETYRRLRQHLLDANLLVDDGSHYKFAEDTVFSSPSAASNMVLGRQSAGPIEWIDSSKRTYKEITEVS
jgi:hypothetical protein